MNDDEYKIELIGISMRLCYACIRKHSRKDGRKEGMEEEEREIAGELRKLT